LKMPICGAGSWAWCRESPVTEELESVSPPPTCYKKIVCTFETMRQ
jgi:hypothetical protein